jgi:hypothetical protein
MTNINITEHGVYKLLKNQKPHKATGPDEVPAFILRSAAQQLAPILTQIYRHSLDIGAVPQDWRDAWVVPIFNQYYLTQCYTGSCVILGFIILTVVNQS